MYTQHNVPVEYMIGLSYAVKNHFAINSSVLQSQDHLVNIL